MLIFAGLEGDAPDVRAAKLKALQDYFSESDARAWNMLGPKDLGKSNPKRGKTLVINSHGNKSVFAGLSAKDFYDKLVSNGFENGSFDTVYLMACLIGQQTQDGSITTNFARDLYRQFTDHGIAARLYAPRGLLTYTLKQETKAGQNYYVVTSMVIRTTEKDYPLSEGLLLVQV